LSPHHALFDLSNHGLGHTVSLATSPTTGAPTDTRVLILVFIVVVAIFILGRSFSTLRGVTAEIVGMMRILAQLAKAAILVIGVVLLLVLTVIASFAQR
jgi:flagellar biosynthesis protein FlhB